jgi:hypothetical protein
MKWLGSDVHSVEHSELGACYIDPAFKDRVPKDIPLVKTRGGTPNPPLVLCTANGSLVEPSEWVGLAALKPPMDFCRCVLATI